MCIAINMGSAVGSNVEMMRCIKSIIELARAGVTDFVEFTNPFLRNLDQMQEEDVHNVAHTIYLRVLHLRRDSVNINKYGTKNCESNVLFQTKLWGLLEFVCSIHDYDDWRLNDALSTLDRAMQDEVNMWYCDIHFLLPLFVILSKFQDKLAEIQHEKVVCILLGVGYDLQKCELCDDKNKLTLLRNAVYHYVEKEDQCSLDCVLI